MVDGPDGLERVGLRLQRHVLLRERRQGGVREGDVVEGGEGAFLGHRDGVRGVEDGDAVVLVVVADEGDDGGAVRDPAV